ncbi:Eco57I restriction-modification methylase domain-containing protein [Microcoleus sp. B6-A1]|uniref:Eco57I restriction-modification methylase domain-containing protein n=1 Tax=Microcoleus sp. B6-A1 TaxID=2818684 RepID=UPI002FD5EB79
MYLIFLRKAIGIKYEEAQLTGKPKKRILNINDIHTLEPFHWGYHFDKVFARGGFDAIITNPPWETFQPNAKEFFTQYSDLVSKKKMHIKDFEDELKRLLNDKEIETAWLEYQSKFTHQRQYFRFAEQYNNQVPVINGKRHGKDVNLYKLFLEQCLNLLRDKGECGIVIPSGIYSDLGAKKLRESLFNETQITGLFCFENRKEIFESVHRSFKFIILTFEKGGRTESFPTRFMRHDVSELCNFPTPDDIRLDIPLIRKLSPDSLSIMEFKNDIDVQIAKKMLHYPLLGENISNAWNLELHREFNMTDDAFLFHKDREQGMLPLYEGKMIHQFTHQFAEPRYWVDEKEARKSLLGKKETDKGQNLNYQGYRLAYRAIASSTNERTLITSTIPTNSFAGNSLNLSSSPKDISQLLVISSFLNSFCVDYSIRQQVSANINMFYIYQLPVPRLQKDDRWFEEIVERAAKLICTTPEFDELAKEVGLGSHRNGVTNEVERGKLRAELDGMIAHIYGLTEEEFAYILTTFPIVTEPVKQAALNAYRDVERGLIR